MQRRVYCVGLRKHVEVAIDDIVSITGKRGTKYQCVGKYSENGKDYVVKSWVSKADYEALHGPVVEIEDIAAAEEFIGADVEAAKPLAADPVADSPVAEDSSEPLEVAPAEKSYFLSESVVLSAIKEMSAEYHYEPFLNYGSFAHTPCQAEIVFDIDDAGTSKENTGKCEECGEIITIEKDEWDRIQAHMMGEMDLDFYVCISCGEEMDEEDGHELVGEFQEKCCLPCYSSAFGAEDECSSCKGTGTSDYYAPCELCMGNMEFDDMECRDCHGSGASDYYAPCEECSLPRTPDYTAEQTFEATSQTKDRQDQFSSQAALKLIKGAYGFKRIISGPVYYRFVGGTSSKFLMFAVIERNNGTYQAVNVYGRRGANFPTLWTSDPYSTEAQAERASKAKQQKKSRKGYQFLDAEEFRSFMAEHFNAETLNSSESIDKYMSEDVWVVELANQDGFRDAEFLGSSDDAQAYHDWVVEQDAGMTPWEITHIKDEQVLTLAKAKERFTQLYVLDDDEGGWRSDCDLCKIGKCDGHSLQKPVIDYSTRWDGHGDPPEGYDAESPLDESPVDDDPLTADPSDMGGPEDFSADASIDLEKGKITILEKGAKSGSSKKLLLGVIVAAGLVAAYQNSDAVLEFFEGLKTDDDSDPVVGCMDETANNYNPDATEDDGSCTFDDDSETTV